MAKQTKPSFNVQRTTLRLTNAQQIIEYLRGKTIQIINMTGGHNYGPVGTKFVVSQYAYVSGSAIGGARNDGSGNNISFTSFTVLNATTEKELLELNKELKEQVNDIQFQIDSNLDKIAFMKEVKSEEFNENEFKAYRTLKLVENPKLTTIQKAKLIAELIN